MESETADKPTAEVEKAARGLTLGDALAMDITLRREQRLKDATNSYPRTHSILSDIGECDRQMVYSVTNWKDRPPIEPSLKARFEAGNTAEREVVGELRQLGYDVVLQQEVIEIHNRKGELIGRGKIDGQIKFQGFKFPVEVKSMHPNVFDRINTIDDFKKKPYLRKYIRQLLMYLFGKEVQQGIFLLTNCLGAWKIIVMNLDLAEAEQALQRLERVDVALKNKTLPERIEFDDELCGQCPFMMICVPDVMRTEAELFTDEVFLSDLDRRDKLRAARDEYEALDKSVKDQVKRADVKKGIAGEFIISVSKREQAEKIVKGYTETRINITKLKTQGS